MGGTGQKYQVNMFQRKPCRAPLRPMKRGIIVPSRRESGAKFKRKK